MGEIVLALKDVSAVEDGRAVLDRVSFSVAQGSVYALLGREPGPSPILRCLLGQLTPSSGDVFLFGESAGKAKSKQRRRIAVVAGARAEKIPALLAAALARAPELLLLESPAAEPGAGRPFLETLRGRREESVAAVLLTAPDAAGIEGVASRVGILKGGRLRVDEEVSALKSNFRKLSYRNEMTESRTDYGTELDEFDAVSVRVRGWGIEAIVRDYGEDKFQRLRARDGVTDATAAPISLEDLFLAIAGPVALRPAM